MRADGRSADGRSADGRAADGRAPASEPAAPPARGPRVRANAAERILEAAADTLERGGAAAVSLQDVADQAGVSKGLIHYHFRDRETLLARLADWLAAGLVAREAEALAEVAPAAAMDALWAWLEGELARGHVRALLALEHEPGAVVREAALRAARLRREQAARTVEHLFELLALRPRLPAPLLAEVVVAFVDGLALDAVRAGESPPRMVFDAFWLSLLSLAE